MRKRMIEFLVLLMVALGAGPVGAAFWQWSKTASSNSTADPSINWAEGMAPSAVNDSARAMMARAAEYRDDISGLLATGGTPTAYTVTTNQGLSSTPNDGQLLAFTVNSTNGASPTLTADGGTAYAIQSSPGVAVASGTLISGSPYSVKFSTTNSAWMLRGFYASPTIIPLGALVAYTGATAPNSNFILPAGQCISTTTYATYWVLMGSPASGACPGGQFAVIDMRGRSPVALDNLNGSAANRLTNSSLGCGTAMTSVGAVCSNGNESRGIAAGNVPPLTYTGTASLSVSSVQGAIPSSVTSHGTVDGFGGTSFGVLGGAGGTVPAVIGTITSTGSAPLSVTASGTNGTAMPIINPVLAVTYLLRVL